MLFTWSAHSSVKSRSHHIGLIISFRCAFEIREQVHFLMWWFIKLIIASSISIIELDKVNQSLDFHSVYFVGHEKKVKERLRNFSNFNWKKKHSSHCSHHRELEHDSRSDGFDGSNSSRFKLEREHIFFSHRRADKWIIHFFLLFSTMFNVKFSTSVGWWLRPAAVDIHYSRWTVKKLSRARIFVGAY